MRVMSRIAVLVIAAVAYSAENRAAEAQTAWQPSAGHTQIPIWPGSPPDARALDGAEVAGIVTDRGGRTVLVGGKPWTYVNRVSKPAIVVYSPTAFNTGAAVIVFPGGGYNVLAIDLEGTEACDWLVSRGVTCVLLKYRVPCQHVGRYRDCLSAHQDAQRALRLVRARAREWKIAPDKIGVMGFSAGGHMVLEIATSFDTRRYAPVDSIDRLSARPDFAIALYPGHVVASRRDIAPNPDIHVTPRASPTFLVHAYDDPVDPVENSLFFFDWLRKAKVQSEIHVYATGGHAFGLRRTNAPITEWPVLAERWLEAIGMIPKR